MERAFARSERSAQSFNRKVSSTAGGIAKAGVFAGAAAGVLGVTVALRAGIEEFSESTKVAAQTEAVLKSTGKQANVTAEQVDALSKSLMNKSGVDDEVIKSGENVLLTFTSIRNEVGKGNDIFRRATKAALDMSVAMHQDLQTSVVQVGKALNDPIRGLGALRRVGVAFTEDQVKQVKALVATGKTMEAQKVILRELNVEFAGQAAAVGGTLPVKIKILEENLRNLAGVIVGKLAPAFTRLVDRATKWVQNVENQRRVVKFAEDAMKLLKDIFDALKPIVLAVTSAVKAFTGAIGGTKNAVYLLVGAFVAFKAVGVASSIAGVTASLTSPAGLVAAAGLASFALTTMALKATGLDAKLKSLGGSAYDAAAAIGLVNNAGKQFEGKTNLSQGAAGFLRRQASRLEAGGMTPAAAAARIVATHPNVALRDAQVLAGVYGSRPLVVHTTINLDGNKVATSTTNHQIRGKRRNPEQKRGPFAGGRVQ